MLTVKRDDSNLNNFGNQMDNLTTKDAAINVNVYEPTTLVSMDFEYDYVPSDDTNDLIHHQNDVPMPAIMPNHYANG